MKYFIPIEMVWNSYCWNFSMVIQMKHFFFVLRYVELALIISIETSKNLTQLLSTSNKSSSSGEMKITWRGLVYIGERDLTPLVINDELWRLIFTPLQRLIDQWSVSLVGVRRLVQLSLTCASMFSHLFRSVGMKGMTLLNSCLCAKELA